MRIKARFWRWQEDKMFVPKRDLRDHITGAQWLTSIIAALQEAKAG